MALGEAVITGTADFAAFAWNPALAAYAPRMLFGMENISWLVDTRYNHFAAVIPTPAFTLGAYLSSWSMPDMPVRTEYYQEGTGEQFNAGSMVLAVGISRRLTDFFALGGVVKLVQDRIWHSSARSFALDLGSHFTIDVGPGLRVATVLMNYGGDLQMDGRDLWHYYDPDQNMQGNNDQILSAYETESWPLPLMFKVGLGTDLIKQPHFRWSLELDALHPNDNYESLDCGTELVVGQRLFIRLGVNRLLLKHEEPALSGGLALELSRDPQYAFRFSYAFRDHRDLGIIHSFALQVGL